MKTRILTFAEHAEVSPDGKLTIRGTADGVNFLRAPGIPSAAIDRIPIPNLSLVVVLEGGLADGLGHTLQLRIVDEDHHEIGTQPQAGHFQFVMNRFGRPMRAQLIIGLHGLALPRPGDYEFQLLVDGKAFDATPFYLTDDTPDGE